MMPAKARAVIGLNTAGADGCVTQPSPGPAAARKDPPDQRPGTRSPNAAGNASDAPPRGHGRAWKIRPRSHSDSSLPEPARSRCWGGKRQLNVHCDADTRNYPRAQKLFRDYRHVAVLSLVTLITSQVTLGSPRNASVNFPVEIFRDLRAPRGTSTRL